MSSCGPPGKNRNGSKSYKALQTLQALRTLRGPRDSQMPEEPQNPHAPKGNKTLKTLRISKASTVSKASKACQAYTVPEDNADPIKHAWATAHAAAARITEKLKVEIEGAKSDANYYRDLLNEQEADAMQEATTAYATIYALKGDCDRYREVAKYYKDKVTRQDAVISQQMRVAHETSVGLAPVRDDVANFNGAVGVASDVISL